MNTGREMKRLTATQAIKQECRYCMNRQTISGPVGCYVESCQLNKLGRSALKRIKAHCIECNPQQSAQGARVCDGKALNPVPHDCPLHPYREGRNPSRKGIGRKGPRDMSIIRAGNRTQRALLDAETHNDDEVIPEHGAENA